MNPPPPAPPVTLSGRVNIGINIAQGNTDAKTYYGDAELVARTEKLYFLTLYFERLVNSVFELPLTSLLE